MKLLGVALSELAAPVGNEGVEGGRFIRLGWAQKKGLEEDEEGP
jgi:hypothetical protein